MKRALYLLSILLLSACNGNFQNIGRESDPVRFYSLAATAKPSEKPTASFLVVGIGPIYVADYLDRSQIIVRRSQTELELGEFDRWAGKLDKEIQRVMTENIATGLSSESVISHPWKSAIDPDVSLEMTIERFERDETGKAVLSANWQLYRKGGHSPLLFRHTMLTKESGSESSQLTVALSELLGELSQEIIDRIRTLVPKNK